MVDDKDFITSQEAKGDNVISMEIKARVWLGSLDLMSLCINRPQTPTVVVARLRLYYTLAPL